MKNEKHTYERLMRNTIAQMAELRPDADAKLRERLNKKFAKYAKKAGVDIRPKQNGITADQNN